MLHLRLDIARFYTKRLELFERRWSLGPQEYLAQASQLNATIRGYEQLLCTHFAGSLHDIFPLSEAAAE